MNACCRIEADQGDVREERCEQLSVGKGDVVDLPVLRRAKVLLPGRRNDFAARTRANRTNTRRTHAGGMHSDRMNRVTAHTRGRTGHENNEKHDPHRRFNYLRSGSVSWQAMEGSVSEFEFRGSEEPIVLAEDFTNDSANGTRTWEAGILLARYVEAQWADKMAGKRVLELGPGTGLLSVYLGRLRASVVSCDYNALVVALLKRNVASNGMNKRVTVRKFDWGEPLDVASLGRDQFDFVMGADCVFSLAATAKLVECLDAAMGTAAVGFMSIETRDAAVTEAFARGIRDKGFEVATVSLRGVDKEYTHPSIAIYRFQRKS